jgi:hypothetical protein
VTPSQFGWYQPPSVAPKTAKAQPSQATQFAVPPSVVVTLTPSQYGWYQPLSVPAPTAKAQQGASFVPFNTPQVALPSTAQIIPLAYDAGSVTPRQVYYQSLVNPLRPMAAAPSNTIVGMGWYAPLAGAAPKAVSVHTQPTFAVLPVTVVTPTVTLAWQQPLSIAARRTSAAHTQPTFQTLPVVVAAAGRVKVWNGTSWILKPTKVWTGASWDTKPAKVWNGTAWV